MSSNENAKANPKKLGKLKGCALILFGFAIIIPIFGIISGKNEDGQGQQQGTPEQVQQEEHQKQSPPEQVEKDSLTIKQEKRDSLLEKINLEYSYMFGRGSVVQDIVNRCEYSDMIANTKSLVEQGATVEVSDTLMVTSALAQLEEEKKDMSIQMQTVRKIAIKSGEDIQRLEKAYNIDLKVINDKIKNCKELKKVLVKNLKENQ